MEQILKNSPQNLLCLGLMSGTSMDGIDAAIIVTDGKEQIKQLGAISLNYDPAFQILLKAAEYAVRKAEGNLALAEEKFSLLLIEYLQIINREVTELKNYLYGEQNKPILFKDIINHSTILHAKIVKELLAHENLTSKQIDLIGYHGQTLYHNPIDGITIQVGDGELLANLTEITVINDFRSNDVKNGGQGAPLAPIYHQALAIRDKIYPLIAVNCGGIANLTIITGPNQDDLYGFDVGPGNVLIDQYVRKHTSDAMDYNGKYGMQGKVSQKVLNCLINQAMIKNGINFLELGPPKSFDSGDFKVISALDELSIPDACATLAAFSAHCIIDSLKFIQNHPPKAWVLLGGGFNNPVITKYFTEMLVIKHPGAIIYQASEIAWDSKYIEAEIFAYLAARCLKGFPISFPQITNIANPASGGKAYISNNPTAIVKQLLHTNPKILTGNDSS